MKRSSIVAVFFCSAMMATLPAAAQDEDVVQQYVSFENDVPTPETLAETERRAPVVAPVSQVSEPRRFGLFGRSRPAQTTPASTAPRLPKHTPTLPALEPGATDAQIRALEAELNEPYLNPVTQYAPSTRGPIKRILLFWKPEQLAELKAPGAPSNVIVGDDPRQRDRDWQSIIASLPPEPSTPTIEIFLSRQAGRYRGMVFPALGGNRYATPKGNFRVNFKSKDHYSRKYDSPMPYSLFFTAQCAIHEGSLYLYSHGCIHVNRETAKMLFDEAVAGKTPVVVRN